MSRRPSARRCASSRRPNRLLKIGRTMKLMSSASEVGRRLTARAWISGKPWMRRNGICRSRFGSLRHSGRHHHRHSSEAQQVAGCHRELELVIDSLQAAKHGLTNAANGLAPSEVLLDALADNLAQVITGMPGSAAVDRAATAAGVVTGDMRGDVPLAACGDEVGRVVGFVSADAAATGISVVRSRPPTDPAYPNRRTLQRAAEILACECGTCNGCS